MDMEIEKVMNRDKVAKAIHSALDTGMELLNKKTSLEADDFSKLKIMRTMGSFLNASVEMIRAEIAQQRLAVVVERMKQLGYSEPKSLKE